MHDPLRSTTFDALTRHSTRNDVAVTRLNRVLTDVGINTWVDHEPSITYRDHWDRAIHEAANSAKSEYCFAELNRILPLGKKLFIAMIDPVPLALLKLINGVFQGDLCISQPLQCFLI